MENNSLFRQRIAIPQDHGSWVFLLSPLLIGLVEGGSFSLASLALILAAFAAFLLRQPVTSLVKVISRRRPHSDLRPALFWTGMYGLIGLLMAAVLLSRGNSMVLWLAVPAIPVFAWHLILVSQREERHQAGVEILATGVLALAAPAAYWVGRGAYNPQGWYLWGLTWLQSAASIVYAYLRLEQRTWKVLPLRAVRFQAGWKAMAYTSFNLLAAILGGLGLGLFPALIFIPFAVQWLETLWGIEHPALGWKPFKIGARQLIVSALFTAAFIIFWR